MRFGIRDVETRDRTITLYIDKKKFLDELQITNEKTIYLYVLDNNHQVALKIEGAFNEEKGQQLTSFLEANIQQ